MLKVKIVELPQSRTIEKQLHDTVIDLLPSEMAQNYLVRWVVEYDSLIREVHREDKFIDSLERSLHEDRWQIFISNHLANSALQMKLPFYFGTLFHIGRMRKVSEITLETVSNISNQEDKESFFTCASSLAEHLIGENAYSHSVEILQKLSSASQEYHSHQLAKAEQWWKIWQAEVRPLREAVEARREGSYRNDYKNRRDNRDTTQNTLKLWLTASLPSQLQMSMSAEGVRFKSTPSQTMNAGGNLFNGESWLMPFLFMGMGDERDSGYVRHMLHDLLYVERERQEAEHERRIEPQVQITLDCLKAKYGNKNPFDDFAIGKHAATLDLREFVKENGLPNRKPSPWLHTWKQTFEDMPYSSDLLPKPVGHDEGWLRLALRQADSAIKKEITNRILPTETWNDFIQRIFEDKWVKSIGEMAGTTNKKASSTTHIWSLDEFVDFVEKVAAKLNGIGYSLKIPEKSRLKTLLDKTSRGDSVYGEDAW
jgi:hypothetical protein